MSDEILDAIDEASAWMDIEGVESVGQGEEGGRDCILVGVSRQPDEMRAKLPDSIRGYPVVIAFTGAIRAR